MRRLLFIGGPNDAETIGVEDGRDWVAVPVLRRLDCMPLSHQNQAPPAEPETSAKVEYNRERLREGGKSYEVMFYSEGGEGLIEALLSGYKGAPVKPQ